MPYECADHLHVLVPAGVDLDYEPSNSNCVVGSTGVTCATDAESVSVTTGVCCGKAAQVLQAAT